jgi:hypothetical protein
MYRLLMIIVLCAGLFAGFAYFRMYQQAEQFNNSIQTFVLGPFDRRAGLDSVNESVMTLAKEHNILIHSNNIDVRIVKNGTPQAASMAGISVSNSGRESIEVTTTFTVELFVFSKTFTKTAQRHLQGMGAPGSSHHGFSGGVNVPGPGRDVQSHRQSIERATGGR